MSNRYQIIEQIGKGGLGAVYKALDTQLQREVAIKRVLSPGQATEEEVQAAADNLMAEAQTLSSLNHPNIITVFDVGQDEEGGFVVMELLKGETLDETIERGVLTQDDFTEVVYQTQEALIAAQANSVIHRDIKPTNIMVIWQASGKFQTKILDFGLAKFSKNPSVQTMDQDESVMGSIFFMAPEQFERGELDSRTDLYQMGCVYYNALTGQYPFNGETAPQVMNAHLQHKVVPLEQVRPDLSPSICQWVMWLINRDIDHRPKDAREAIKRWPKNPEPPGAIPVEVLPVEDTPEVKSGAVKIVTTVDKASAPPALIVGNTTSANTIGATTGRLQTGNVTGRVTGGGTTGSVTAGRPNVHRGPQKTSGKTKWIILGSAISAILIFVAAISISKSAAEKKVNRIIELSSAEPPTGTTDDISLAVDFLSDPKTSPSLRSDAYKVVEKLEGNGISEKILEELKESESVKVKVNLANALAEREFEPAVPAIIAGFKQTSQDNYRLQYLSAIQGLANMDNVDEILAALQGDHSREVRNAFENTVLAVLRKSDNPEPITDSILTRVSTVSGNERKSLFRILGTMGGDKVRTRLNSIYNKKNDMEYQRDAMLAYLSWQDRSVLGEVESIINNTEDKGLRSAAERAFVRLATLPGPESPKQLRPIWNKTLQLIQNPNDIRRLFTALIESPNQEALEFLKAKSTVGKYANYAKPAANTMEKAIAGVPTIKPGEKLPGNKARVHGDKRAAINSFMSAITSWTSPETWFSWTFRISEGGEYAVEIDQATLREEPSDYVVYLAGKTLNGKSMQTATLEDFKTVSPGGTVTLEPNMIYTATLAAGKKVQPRMMDVGGFRLVKK